MLLVHHGIIYNKRSFIIVWEGNDITAYRSIGMGQNDGANANDIRNKGEGSCGKRSYATFNSNMTILLPLLLMDNRSQFKSLSAKHLAKRTVQGLIGLKHFSKARRAIVK
ncbi:hypothetical protein HanRHA438_Chr08g0370651 [Helianthus annuus]|nr:hypothetical protein HanRHA438_Chr08g0370651 [Helianthus annuus]